MIKVKDKLTGEVAMRHKMCSCGRGRASFGSGDDAHCLQCTWDNTARHRRSEHYSRPIHGRCKGCNTTSALYGTKEGRRCHWCRQKIQLSKPQPEPEPEEDVGPEMWEMKCDYCGKTFERKASQVRSQRNKGQEHFYCNQACFHKDRQLATQQQG